MTTNDKSAAERNAFETAHKHLDLSPVSDAWGSTIYAHGHVQAMWSGWQARASLTTPSKEPAGAVIAPPIECTTCGALVVGVAPLTSAPAEPRNEWKEAVLDALSAWPGMDFAQDTPPRTIIDAVLRIERESAVTLSAPAEPSEAIGLIDEWMHVPTLKLRAGEMSAQEMRTVLGVLGAIRAFLKLPVAPVETPPAAGAIDAREQEGAAKRLRAIVKLVGLEKAVPEDDATLWACAFTVLGSIRNALASQKPFGYVLHWPSPGGGTEELFARSRVAGDAIGCKVTAVFASVAAWNEAHRNDQHPSPCEQCEGKGEISCGWTGEGKIDMQPCPECRHAQPCASQGYALSHAQVEAAYTAWCHSKHPDPFVRMSTALRAALSTAKSGEHGATDGGTGE
jgi:hypothetical protein